MYTRLLKIQHKKSFFLFGPRGTGKTSWIKSHFPNSLYFDLLDSDLRSLLLAHPKKLESLIPPDFEGWVLIDEIQKVPELLNEVHRLIENYGYHFVLTGSSARSLRKKGVNLLAGRALTFHMHPLTAHELKGDFDLAKSLEYGHLPAVFKENDPQAYLKSYVQTYLLEEVLQEGLTRNLGAFTRFLQVASFSQGSVLNLSEIAREASINRKVVESYFQIVEDLLLGVRLNPFTKRAQRAVVGHPKFYFFDTGVYRAIRPMGPIDSPEEAQGIALETLVYQELAAYNDYAGLEYSIHYWRTTTGHEIDFILYGPKGIIAVEVKRSQHVSLKDFNALKQFGKDYPEARLFMLYGGTRKEYHQNITVLPVADTLIDLNQLFIK